MLKRMRQEAKITPRDRMMANTFLRKQEYEPSLDPKDQARDKNWFVFYVSKNISFGALGIRATGHSSLLGKYADVLSGGIAGYWIAYWTEDWSQIVVEKNPDGKREQYLIDYIKANSPVPVVEKANYKESRRRYKKEAKADVSDLEIPKDDEMYGIEKDFARLEAENGLTITKIQGHIDNFEGDYTVILSNEWRYNHQYSIDPSGMKKPYNRIYILGADLYGVNFDKNKITLDGGLFQIFYDITRMMKTKVVWYIEE